MGCWSSPAPLGRREGARNHPLDGSPGPPLESPTRRSRGPAASLQRSPAERRSSEPTGSVDKQGSSCSDPWRGRSFLSPKCPPQGETLSLSLAPHAQLGQRDAPCEPPLSGRFFAHRSFVPLPSPGPEQRRTFFRSRPPK